MPPIPDSARAVLDSDALAHLVTLEPEGRPQVTIVWVGLDGDEIVAAHIPDIARSTTSATTPAWRCPSRPDPTTPWA